MAQSDKRQAMFATVSSLRLEGSRPTSSRPSSRFASVTGAAADADLVKVTLGECGTGILGWILIAGGRTDHSYGVYVGHRGASTLRPPISSRLQHARSLPFFYSLSKPLPRHPHDGAPDADPVRGPLLPHRALLPLPGPRRRRAAAQATPRPQKPRGEALKHLLSFLPGYHLSLLF
jgi:hypothetical protein